MSGQQRDIILQESLKASFQAKLPEEKPFLCRASSRIRTEVNIALSLIIYIF